MNPNLAGLIDGALFFGVIIAILVWQLVSTGRAKQRRIAREKAAAVDKSGPTGGGR